MINDDMLVYKRGKWRKRYFYWYTFSTKTLGYMPKKGKKMTQNTETKTVTLTPEQEAALVQGLQTGEVLVQTQDDVGTEQKPVQPTVH
jgi:hypothetical protein